MPISSSISTYIINKNPLIPVFCLLCLVQRQCTEKALAQSTGRGIVPVCFGCGSVAYVFEAFWRLLSNGRLMPVITPDCSVYNAKNRSVVRNGNWAISQLFKSHVASMNNSPRAIGEASSEVGQLLRIGIYEPVPHPACAPYTYTYIIILSAQFAIAAMTLKVYGDYFTLVITALGSLLVAATGLLPQWQAEKLPMKPRNTNLFAIANNDTSRDIMIVLNSRPGYDLQKLATFPDPLFSEAWQQRGLFTKRVDGAVRVDTLGGLPVDVWLTRLVLACLAAGSLFLMLLATAVPANPWALGAIALLGLAQNAYVSACVLDLESQSIPLTRKNLILTNPTKARRNLQVYLENVSSIKLERNDIVAFIKLVCEDK